MWHYKMPESSFFFVLSYWPKTGQIGRLTRNSNPVMTFSTGGAKGSFDDRFHAPPAYASQLLTLHQHRANNQYRTANQIWPTLRVSSDTQTKLELSPIQVLTELYFAWLQRSYKNASEGFKCRSVSQFDVCESIVPHQVTTICWKPLLNPNLTSMLIGR